jgi:hypothetical protein
MIGRPSRGQAKPVVCFDPEGRRKWFFFSVTEAARVVGTGKADNICDAIRRGGKCAGLTWSYANAIPEQCRRYVSSYDQGALLQLVRLLAREDRK